MSFSLFDTEDLFIKGKIEKRKYIENMYSFHGLLFDYSNFIRNRDISKIEITDGSVVFTTRQHAIKIISKESDQRMAPIEILNFKRYEDSDFDMVIKLLKDDDVVFDIGGNIGYYSIAMSKIKSNLKIHAFEPIPSTYEMFIGNKMLNNADITVNNFGLSDEDKELTFYYYKEGSGNASAAIMDEERDTSKINCKVKKMDDYFEISGLNRLDFIKCDVEGAELFAFKGGLKTIEKYKPIIFTEMLRKWSAKFNYHPNDIIKLLAPIGYSCYYECNGELVKIVQIDDDTKPTNFFFLHNVMHVNFAKV